MAIKREVEKNGPLTVERWVETTILAIDVVHILHEMKETGTNKDGVSFLSRHYYKQGSEWHQVTYDVIPQIETGKLQISSRMIYEWEISKITGDHIGKLKVRESYDKNGNLKRREEFQTPSARRAQALRPDSNGFCPQCRGELRSPKRYIIKAQVP
ncbi:MAG: hypothetical protein EWV77_05665 [Microcystis viridis Mv_BB_P_19951000_S68D]|uniref:Uncharacterized protein n=1 Tax=Microcystis viridis Mv_BB_P_19951000_S68D TaxID=2486270 RepID=A0A552I253_MICVR|nr:MAG: hypothetical protein EWV77_05665 [Microcystis viridis Mv_BB_P_19951000_S68D]